ncbi:MAG: hypothetical protein JNK77_16765, partial [Saprospiraceae bacterium]|nr:hypothetical protein [Saprospiraceae bacterium]
EDASMAIYRAANLYYNHRDDFDLLRSKVMQIDFSWERAAGHYIHIYEEMTR